MALETVDRTFVRVGQERYSCFSGCDYFRLATHPEVVEAAARGLKDFGVNVAASRITTGNHPIYEKLESALADFFGVETAVLVTNGYASNLVATQALAGQFTHALLDSRAHASLKDAARFLEAQTIAFKHRDSSDLAGRLANCPRDAKLILLSDGLFAHDGSVAPLSSYRTKLGSEALFVIDDAHAAGVLGARGQGSLEHCGMDRDRVLQTITLSKAFGAYGGAILCTRRFRERVLLRSSMFQASTPPPFPAVCAALKSLELLRSDPGFRSRLKSNLDLLTTELSRVGITRIPRNPGPVLGFVPRSAKETTSLSYALLRRGIYPPLIHYPGGDAGGYFRFAISSEHTREQLHQLVEALCMIRDFPAGPN